ncbi:hypothetical protein CPC08DRAFT_122894 [Agrocybe pediades]|nr:hypothetical protein CPC08DRAFT_122894 [Agrocybe pediades]
MVFEAVDGIHQRRQYSSADSDEIPLVNFGPDGEVQVIKGEDPPASTPEVPDVVTGDDGQVGTATPDPPTNGPATEFPPNIATSVQDTFSTGGVLPSQSDYATVPPATPTTTQNDETSSGFAQPTTIAITPSELPTSYSTEINPSAFSSRFTSSADSTALSASKSTLTTTATSSATISSQISSFSSHSVSVHTLASSISSSSSHLSSSSSIQTSRTSSLISSTSSSSSTASASQSSTFSVPSPASETVTAPHFQGDQSSLNVHNTPYYAGIALATFGGVVLLAALIAWFVRCQSRGARRRRAKATTVPWARPIIDDDDAGGLEAGHGYGAEVMNPESRTDFQAHVPAWTPHGDRYLYGEARHAESGGYFGTPAYSPYQHTIPSSDLFSEETISAVTGQRVGVSLARPRYPSRCLPSHLIDKRAAAQGQPLAVVNGVPASLNPSYCSSEDPEKSQFQHGGTSPASSFDQALGFGGIPQKQTMAERLRNLGNKPKETIVTEPWDGLGPLPTPGGHTVEPGGEPGEQPWASNLKTSLANAFNAVAANLSLNTGAAKAAADEDRLTTAPPRRNSRKSTKSAAAGAASGLGLAMDEKASVKSLSRGDPVSSKAWTLEETGDGVGVVHLLKTDKPAALRPSMPGPNLSFGDGENFGAYDARGSHTGDNEQKPQIPLVASSMPQPAHILDRPPPVSQLAPRQISGEDNKQRGFYASVSRESSVYSTASMPRARSLTSKFTTATNSRLPSIASDDQIPDPRNAFIADEDSVVIQPSRLNSVDSSIDVTRPAAKALEGRSEIK